MKAKGFVKALFFGSAIVITTSAISAFLMPPGYWQDYLPKAGLLLALLVCTPMTVKA